MSLNHVCAAKIQYLLKGDNLQRLNITVISIFTLKSAVNHEYSVGQRIKQFDTLYYIIIIIIHFVHHVQVRAYSPLFDLFYSILDKIEVCL